MKEEELKRGKAERKLCKHSTYIKFLKINKKIILC